MSDPNNNQKKRQMLTLGVVAVVFLGLLYAGMTMFDTGKKPSKKKPVTTNIEAPGKVSDEEKWRSTAASTTKSQGAQLVELQGELKALKEKNEKLQNRVQEMESSKTTPVSSSKPSVSSGSILDNPLGTSTGLSSPVTSKQPSKEQSDIKNAEKKEPSLVVFSAPAKTAESKSPKKEADETINFISANSFIRVFMLNGVDAPTASSGQSNPMPVSFEALDMANLSNKYKLDIRGCRVLGAAYGDLPSERAIIRAETLTCIINGETVEMTIKGQAVGEDGKVGIRGRLVTKQGQMLFNAAVAGIASGIGKAFQSAATINTTTGSGVVSTVDSDKVTNAALGGGFGNAGQMLADYYMKAADKLFPVIETDGGRVVEILITKGSTLTVKKGEGKTYSNLMNRPGQFTRNGSND